MNLKQSRTTSFLESALNTGSGFLLSLVCQWAFLVLVLGLPMTWFGNLSFAVLMTVVSLARSYLWRRYFEARRASFTLSPFVLAVLAERQKQIEIDGYTTAHDDEHAPGEIAAAGAAYLYAGSIVDRRQREQLPFALDSGRSGGVVRTLWPWNHEFWKPRVDDRRRDLVKGCALGIAEGDRMERSRRLARRRTIATGGVVTGAPSELFGERPSEQTIRRV